MSLAEATARAKHDLGKYVAFQLRWLGAQASDAELLEALRADVLNTRRGPSGSESAMALWERLRGDLVGADVGPVDAGIALLQEQAQGLEAGTCSRADLEACSQAALDIARALADLARAHR